jgi:hypothetical protein
MDGKSLKRADGKGVPQDNVLKFGCAAKLQWLLGTLVLICGGLAWRMLQGWENEIVFLAGLPLVFLLLCLVAATVAVWNRYEVDSTGITKRNLLGRHRFERRDFLAIEVISERPGRPPSLLLRFRTGNLHLEGNQISMPAGRIAEFVQQAWGVGQGAQAMLGEAEVRQLSRYEGIHVALALIAGFLLLIVSIRVPMVWVGALLAALSFRVAWRALAWVETDEEGISWHHRFRPTVRLAWSEIESVGFWSAFSQGGMKIHGVGRSILMYRWIENYPKLVRLLHHQVAENKFSPLLHLPMTVSMSGSQRYGAVAAVLLVAANALPFLLDGNVALYAGFVAIPAAGGLLANLVSTRKLEIDRNEIRDVSMTMGIRKVNRFKRADLVDARLGRQMSAGGLWLKFKDRRLELSNRDACQPPEQILACLRREWAWEIKPQVNEGEEPGADASRVA